MSPEQIKQSLKGKQAYTLNISESMTERMLQNAKDIVSHLQSTREEMLPLFEEKRQAYEAAQRAFQETKNEIDGIDEEVRQQQLVVEALTNFKTKDAPGKRLQLHSDGEAPPPEKGKRPRLISWQDEASIVLNDTKRFMRAEDVFDLIMQKQNVQDALKQMKTGKNVSTIKSLTVDNFISHAMKVSKGEWNARFPPTLTLYKDLIGLVGWVKDGKAVEPYNQQFQHKKLQREQPAASA